jgi:hypothetical protein
MLGTPILDLNRGEVPLASAETVLMISPRVAMFCNVYNIDFYLRIVASFSQASCK